MLITYEIEARRFGEQLPKDTVATEHGIAAAIDRYSRRHGKVTEITVKIFEDGSSARRLLGESE